MSTRLIGSIGAALVLAAACGAHAHDYRIGQVRIGHPYTQATPLGVRNAAAYARLENTGSEQAVLVAARSDAAERVEIHRSAIEDGVARMRAVEGGIAIAPGGTVDLAPRSYHIMLFGLKRPLVEGERVGLVLSFEPQGEIGIELAVQAPAPSSPDHSHH